MPYLSGGRPDSQKSVRGLLRKYSTASSVEKTGSGNLSLAHRLIFNTINEKIVDETVDSDTRVVRPSIEKSEVEVDIEMTRDLSAMRRNERARMNCFKLFWYDMAHKQIQMRHKIKEVPILNKYIKHIEGFFGTSVTSFFVFLRWVMVLNFWLSFLWIIFVMLPMIITYNYRKSTKVFHIRNLVDGQDAVEDSWLFFGGYSNDLKGYHMDVAYITIILITYFGSLFLIFRSIASAIQFEGDLKQSFRFSLMVFTYWDYSLTHPKGVADLSMGIAMAMRDGMSEMQIQEKYKSRTREEMYRQYGVRALAWVITLILAAGGMGIIVYVVLLYDVESQAQKDLGQANSLLVTYSVPFTFSIINSVVPSCIRALPKMENYLEGRLELNITVARTFMFRMFTMVTLIISVFIRVKNVNREICTGTLLGQQMYRIVITDTIVDAVVEILYSLGWYLWYDEKFPFSLSYPVLMVIHKQAIIWSGMIVCPALPLVGFVSMYTYFMVMQRLLPMTCTPPTNRWSQTRENVFFNTLLWLALLIIIVVISIIVGSHGIIDIAMTNRNHTCGPFEAETPILTYSKLVHEHFPEFLRKILQTTSSVAVLFPAIAILIAVLYYQRLRIKSEKARGEDLQSEIDELTLEKKDLLRNNRLMKKLTQANASTSKSPPTSTHRVSVF